MAYNPTNNSLTRWLGGSEDVVVVGITGMHAAHRPIPIGVILGLYRDNGKENGNYSLGFRV